MTTDLVHNTKQPKTKRRTRSSVRYSYRHKKALLGTPSSPTWNMHLGTNSIPLAFGQADAWPLASRIANLLKLERQHRERVAAVSLDPTAKKLLNALDRETSFKWGDLPEKADCDWSAASRAAALLARANLCEVSPTRIRLSEHGDKLLAEESAQASESLPEVAS